MVVSGGEVSATGGRDGAGIGGGYDGCGGAVTISGGKVSATGGICGAGIGGGTGGFGGMMMVFGGTVVTTRGNNAPCDIGYGHGGPGSMTNVFTGGSVCATNLVSLAPVNTTEAMIYCVAVSGLTPSSRVAVTGLADYGTNDIWSDASGQIYLWLPDGSYVFQVNGYGYVAAVSGANAVASRGVRVVFEPLGGTLDDLPLATQQVLVATGYTNLPAATRTACTFLGWYDGWTNGATQVTNGMPLLYSSLSHTLYAKWRAAGIGEGDGTSAFQYVLHDGGETASVSGPVGTPSGALVVPDRTSNSAEGPFVTDIGTRAFANRKAVTSLTLPAFCTNIADYAFYYAESLASVTFTQPRDWRCPTNLLTLSINHYAFSSTALTALTVPAYVSSIGDYAFANNRKLASVTFEGATLPTLGQSVFRESGRDVSGGTVIHIRPQALVSATTTQWLALTNRFSGVSVTTNGTWSVQVTGLSIHSVSGQPVSALCAAPAASVSLSAVSAETVVLTFRVTRRSSWGALDVSAIRIFSRETLDGAATILTPTSIVDNGDGTVTATVAVPPGSTSGFFQPTVE